jgi:hypothetical protein
MGDAGQESAQPFIRLFAEDCLRRSLDSDARSVKMIRLLASRANAISCVTIVIVMPSSESFRTTARADVISSNSNTFGAP